MNDIRSIIQFTYKDCSQALDSLIFDQKELYFIQGWITQTQKIQIFQTKILPYLNNVNQPIDQTELIDIFLSLQNPNLAFTKSNSDVDLILSKFLVRFSVPNPIDNFVKSYLKLLTYINLNSYPVITSKFLYSLNPEQKIYVFSLLPICDITIPYFMSSLLTHSTFLISFNRLFTSFYLIPKKFLPFFNRCFRSALQKTIFANGLGVMILTILSVSNQQPSSQGCEIIDFFFSALIDQASILAIYLKSAPSLVWLKDTPKCSKLPISYLRFLLFLDYNCQLSKEQIWSLYTLDPNLTLEYIERSSDSEMMFYWESILAVIFSYDFMYIRSIDLTISVFLGFLHSFLLHPNLLSLIDSDKSYSFSDRLLFSANKINIDQKWSILTIILVISRTSQMFSMNFYQKTSFVLNIKELFLNKNENSDDIWTCLAWLLNPTPIISYNDNSQPFHFLRSSICCSSFSSSILPDLYSSLVLKMITVDKITPMQFSKFFADSIATLKAFSIGKILNEEALITVFQYLKMENLNELSYCLSYSCPFSVFSLFYKIFFNDLDKFFKVLNILAENTPLVTDYLRLNTKITLNIKGNQKTFAMWLRFNRETLQIVAFQSNNETKVIILRKEKEMLVVNVGSTNIKFVQLPNSIDGWFLVCISITNEGLTVSVNLKSISIRFKFISHYVMSIGENERSILDIRSIRIYNEILTQNQLRILFFKGPNSTELFFSKNVYISSLYTEWINEQPCLDDEILSFEREISPFHCDFPLIDLIHHQSFMLSLEAYGGLFLLIYLISKVILTRPKLHQLAFDLLSKLLNRYPNIHHRFESNHYYQLIGHVIAKSENKINPLLIMNCVFVNEKVMNFHALKYWLLNYTSYQQELQSCITLLINDNNVQYFDIFTSVVNICENELQEPLFSKLVMLTLKLTTGDNISQNITTITVSILNSIDKQIFSHLLNLFNNGNEIDKIKWTMPKSIKFKLLLLRHLIHIGDFNDQLSILIFILPLLPTDLQIVIYDLVNETVNENVFESWCSLFMLIHFDSDFDHYVYNKVTQSNHLNSRHDMMNLILGLHILTQKGLFSKLSLIVCEVFTTINDQIIYDQLLTTQFYSKIRLNDNQSLVLFYSCAIEDYLLRTNYDLNQIKDFLLNITVIDNSLVFLIVNNIVQKLINNLSVSNTKIDRIVQFLKFVFSCLLFIRPEMNLSDFELIKQFIFLIFSFIDKTSLKLNSEIISCFVYFIFEFNSNYSEYLKPLLEELKSISYLSAFIKDILSRNTIKKPSCIMKESIKPVITKSKIKEILKMANDLYKRIVVNNNQSNFLIVSNWKEIFNVLNFDDSLVYSNLPRKFKLDDNTIRYQLRKILLPMNPSYDNFYLQYWAVKYSSEAPKIDLALSDVVDFNQFNCMCDKIRFKSSVVYISGLLILNCELFVTDYQINVLIRNPNDALIFNFSSITKIILDKYQNQDVGVSIELDRLFVYRFAFHSYEDRVSFINFMRHYQVQYQIKIIHKFDLPSLLTLTNRWIHGHLSNLDYLLQINMFSGRYWSDYTKYPIFPWIFSQIREKTESSSSEDEEIEEPQPKVISRNPLSISKSVPIKRSPSVLSSMIIKEKKPPTSLNSNQCIEKINITSKHSYILRNMNWPFYAQTEKQRMNCETYYKLSLSFNNSPSHYSNYVSNISNALYFLIRLEPTTSHGIAHQDGSLDSADRTFQSLEITLKIMSTPESRSATELIPDIYFLPEMFINVNHIVFPRSPIYNTIVNDVFLPKWAKSPFHYVRFLRNKLESVEVSSTINKWIDLIWGIKQQGKLATESFNTFQEIIFEFDPSQYQNDPTLLRALLTQLKSCGQAPYQLFTSRHPPKKLQPTKKSLIMSRKKLLLSDELDIHISNRHSKTEKILSYMNSFYNNEMTVELLAHYDDAFVVSHKKVPLISYWKIITSVHTNKSDNHHNYELVSVLRGHLVEITALAINENKVVVSGHKDGYLSIFSLNHFTKFVRSFHCENELAISKVKILNDNSTLIVFQNDLQNETCFVSLFSINAYFIASVKLDDIVEECILTLLSNGIQSNYAIVLTKRGLLLVLSMNSLKKKYTIETNMTDIVSLELKDNFILVATRKNESVLSWSLFQNSSYFQKLG